MAIIIVQYDVKTCIYIRFTSYQHFPNEFNKYLNYSSLTLRGFLEGLGLVCVPKPNFENICNFEAKHFSKCLLYN